MHDAVWTAANNVESRRYGVELREALVYTV